MAQKETAKVSFYFKMDMVENKTVQMDKKGVGRDMSVLIKGMEMPECCDKCFALDDHGDYPRCLITHEQRGYNFRVREKRMDKCSLIKVPEHGRLIDADALNRRLNWERDLAVAFGGEVAKAVDDMCDLMIRETEMMPTIIPADKDGEA